MIIAPRSPSPSTLRGNMKIFFLLGLLALTPAICVATAQLEESPREGAQQCQEGREAMDACRDYLKRQCTASAKPITWPWRWRMGSCRALRRRCCHQLEQTPESCRCRAIGSTVQEIQAGAGQGGGHRQTMSKVVQEAKTLPSICNMYPSCCNIPH